MKDTKRFNLSEFKKVMEEDNIDRKATSIKGAYFIPDMNEIGYYKENGGMLFGAENDADLRELLSAEILDVIGMPHAKIIPIYDDENKRNGCFSINILKDNEVFAKIPYKTIPFNTVKELIENDIENISKMPNISPEMLQARRKYVAEYLFTSALLSNTDTKINNRHMIINLETGEYRNSEYYDAGVSFLSNQDRFFLNGKNSEKILSELYKDYAVEIFPLAQQTEQALTKSKIMELMSDSIYDGFDKDVKKDIAIGLNNRVKLITRYNHNILEYGMAEPPTIPIEDINEDTKDMDISLKDKVISFIQNIKNKIIKKDNRDGNYR